MDVLKVTLKRAIEHLDGEAEVKNIFSDPQGRLLAAFSFPDCVGVCIACFYAAQGGLAFYMDNQDAKTWVARGHAEPNNPTAEMLDDLNAALQNRSQP